VREVGSVKAIFEWPERRPAAVEVVCTPSEIAVAVPVAAGPLRVERACREISRSVFGLCISG
jgi:hypothetical protein